MSTFGEKILVVAPHPDDETLGCGGTLLKLKKAGAEIHWLIMTNIFTQQNYSAARVSERQVEIEQVKKAYGFKSVMKLNYPTTELDQVPLGEMIRKVAPLLNELKPDTLFVPHRGDIHSDHRMSFDAVMSCTKSFRYPFLKKVLAYETISETDLAPALVQNVFIPNVFSDITPYIEQKVKIMKLYKGEMKPWPFPRSEKTMQSLAIVRGAAVAVKYAESFMLLKDAF